jgi:ribosome maturation protein Sdo1
MLTDERRAEIEAALEEWRHREEMYAGTAREVVQELLWVIDRMNEIRTSRSELAATTIAGLEMDNAKLRRLLGAILASFDGENLKWRRSMLDELLPVIASALPDGYVAMPWEA